MTIDPSAFHDFEQAGWERAAEHYGDAFGSVTVQTADALLDAVAAAAGARLLDVATGPGFIAGAAAARGADVVGLDFSAAMIEEARRRHPAITFREGDAEALPFEVASFDAVVMNFGLLHLARPDAALAEAHRVLGAGGRYAFTVWASPDRDASNVGTSRVLQRRCPANAVNVAPFIRRRGVRRAVARRRANRCGLARADAERACLDSRSRTPRGRGTCAGTWVRDPDAGGARVGDETITTAINAKAAKPAKKTIGSGVASAGAH